MGVGRERVGVGTDLEVQILESRVLALGNLQKTSGGVFSCAGSLLVSIEGIGGKEDQSCAGVDNTSGGLQDRRSTVADGLVDTPVLASGAGAGDRHIGD